MTKQEALNKLYNIYNKMTTPRGLQKYSLLVIDGLRWLILDIKAQNKAEFILDELFDILKNDFNIKTHGIGYILDLKNN